MLPFKTQKNTFRYFDYGQRLLNILGIDIKSKKFKLVKESLGECCRLHSNIGFTEQTLSASNPIFIDGELSSIENSIEILRPDICIKVETITTAECANIQPFIITIFDYCGNVANVSVNIDSNKPKLGYLKYRLGKSNSHTVTFISNPTTTNKEKRGMYSESIKKRESLLGKNISTHSMELSIGTDDNLIPSKRGIILATLSPTSSTLSDYETRFDPYYVDPYFISQLETSKPVLDLLNTVNEIMDRAVYGLSDYVNGHYEWFSKYKPSSKDHLAIPNNIPSIHDLIEPRANVIRSLRK